jgi:hypothetical protein
MGFGKHKHTGMDKTISGGGGYESIYFFHRSFSKLHFLSAPSSFLSAVGEYLRNEDKRVRRMRGMKLSALGEGA